MIQPVHTQVPGRTRFRVENLRGDSALKAELEKVLPETSGIRTATCSEATGNVLVHHREDMDVEQVAGVIEKLLDKIRVEGFTPAKALKPQGLTASKSLDSPAGGDDEEYWHRMAVERALQSLNSDASKGLTGAEVQNRLDLFGLNTLQDGERRSGWRILKEQFLSLPAGLLGIAAGLSVATGGVVDAVIIVGVLGVNTAIGYVTEKKSERTINALKKLVNHKAKVLRDGKAETIPCDEVVPGDVVLLRPGSYVPADCRILEARNLAVDESSLTGESLPAAKSAKALSKKRLPLPELRNMLFMGSVVTGGTGSALVVATGGETQMGRMQAMLTTAKVPRPPIEGQLARTGDKLVRLWVGACVAVFGIGLLRGFSVLNMLRTSVSLAAAAVPEGLPATATTTFALGVRDMKRHKVLVRNLQAVDTLGSVSTVCFDKTGTITENRMTVMQAFAGMHHFTERKGRLISNSTTVSRRNFPALFRLLEVGGLCSEVKINGHNTGVLDISGTPTENALIRLADAHGLDIKRLRKRFELMEVNHRSEKRSIMGTVHKTEKGGFFHAIKGRPSEVLALCDRQIKNGDEVPLTEEDKKIIQEHNTAMAGDALRVLGFAGVESRSKRIDFKKTCLVWYGLVGMADPIREGVEELVGMFHKAGVRTVMITGDQKITALAVARQLNLSGNGKLTAMDYDELASLGPDELAARVGDVDVFSRVSPAHKLEIVQALQKSGGVVAMTGDGVNDGPALKAADVGIAMGEVGTDVTREAADVVLEEDDLETLVIALRDGRATYANIKRSVRFFLSTNLSETMVVSASMAAGFGSPLTPMQLMWINVISDIFPGLALSMEPPEPDVLDQKPRDAKAPLYSRKETGELFAEAGIMSAATMGVYGYGMLRGGAATACGMAFQTLSTAQLLHALTCRARRNDQRGRRINPWLMAAVGGSLALQAGAFFVPGLMGMLGIPRLGAMNTMVSVGGAAASWAANEAFKSGRRAFAPPKGVDPLDKAIDVTPDAQKRPRLIQSGDSEAVG